MRSRLGNRALADDLRRPHRLGTRKLHGGAISLFIYALATGEIGGFLVLLAGYTKALWGAH